jgi:hypothetical protein
VKSILQEKLGAVNKNKNNMVRVFYPCSTLSIEYLLEGIKIVLDSRVGGWYNMAAVWLLQ